jgi:protein-tyrosine phosphatase
MSGSVAVLVVCEGNLCRSPLAERLLRLRTQGSDVEVTSAGVNAAVGQPVDPLAAEELVRLGGDPEGFAARQLTPRLLLGAQLVLTATRAIRSQVVAMSPTALRRSFTLLELAALLEDPPWPASDGTQDLAATLAQATDWRGSVGVLGDELDLPDPIGRSAKVHRQVADQIDRATQVIAERLA